MSSESQRIVEAGISKAPSGRLPEVAEAEAAAAYRRAPTDKVFRIEPGMSLDEVNALDIAPGATVLFRRGGIWRGHLRVRSGIPGHPVRYGAWGEGPKPVIQPSHDLGDPAMWTQEPNGIWSADTGATADVGNVILNEGDDGCLFKRGSRDELLRDRDFWYAPSTHRVLVRSEFGNPATRWRSLEAAEKRHGFDQGAAHDVVYEGLAVRFGAAHGFGGGGTQRIEILGCDVTWIGGGYLYTDDLGNGVRYGNGIELWGGAEDVRVEGCRVRQCWDAGLTNQSSMPGSVERNIVWHGNEVTECEYSYEFWQQGDGAAATDVVLEDNVFLNAGSWGHTQRWNPNAAHLMFYDTTVPTPGFAVRNNRFSRSADVLARIFNDWRGQAAFTGNVWESAGEPVCRYHGRPRGVLQYHYPDRLDRIHNDDQAEIEAPGSGATVFAGDADGFRRFQSAFGFGPDEFHRV